MTPRARLRADCVYPGGRKKFARRRELDVDRRIAQIAGLAGRPAHDRSAKAVWTAERALARASRSPCAIDVRIALDEIGAPARIERRRNDVDVEAALGADRARGSRVALRPRPSPWS